MRATGVNLKARALFTAAAAAVMFGVFAPWLRSGSSTRSSFEMLDLVDRLGFSPGGLFDWALRGWPLVPLLLVGAVVACWSGRPTPAVAVAGVVAGYVIGCAIAVRSAPDASLVRTGWGVDASLVAGTALLATATWLAIATRSVVPEPALDVHVTQ